MCVLFSDVSKTTNYEQNRLHSHSFQSAVLHVANPGALHPVHPVHPVHWTSAALLLFPKKYQPLQMSFLWSCKVLQVWVFSVRLRSHPAEVGANRFGGKL